MVKIRRLLITKQPEDEIEIRLKKMYETRIFEMFKRSISMESIFNIFDEVFHGLSQTSQISDELNSLYESFLTITSYYQHAQAGRGNLAAKILEEFGEPDFIDYEFHLKKLPAVLDQTITLQENDLTRQKFDIFTRSGDSIAFCELKMKVYSGCSAGRIELMEKFNKIVKLLLSDDSFYQCLDNSSIKNVLMIGGVLFDIEGNPATKEKDQAFGICYNGLKRGLNDIETTLNVNNITFTKTEESQTKAFTLNFSVKNVNVVIVASYGNNVIESLYFNQNKRDISFFKERLEHMLFDDLWLGQIISFSERAILNRFFKNHQKLDNYIISMVNNKNIRSRIEAFQRASTDDLLDKIVGEVMDILHEENSLLTSLQFFPANFIMDSMGTNYTLKDYIGDIIQLLSNQSIYSRIIDTIVNMNT